jgi:2-isopropylmalate synthase
VGVPARRLVLGKHSGRNALRAHLVELGFVTTEEELRLCYLAAMALADTAKQVTDRDLLTIVHQVRRGNITEADEQSIGATTAN